MTKSVETSSLWFCMHLILVAVMWTPAPFAYGVPTEREPNDLAHCPHLLAGQGSLSQAERVVDIQAYRLARELYGTVMDRRHYEVAPHLLQPLVLYWLTHTTRIEWHDKGDYLDRGFWEHLGALLEAGSRPIVAGVSVTKKRVISSESNLKYQKFAGVLVRVVQVEPIDFNDRGPMWRLDYLDLSERGDFDEPKSVFYYGSSAQVPRAEFLISRRSTVYGRLSGISTEVTESEMDRDVAPARYNPGELYSLMSVHEGGLAQLEKKGTEGFPHFEEAGVGGGIR